MGSAVVGLASLKSYRPVGSMPETWLRGLAVAWEENHTVRRTAKESGRLISWASTCACVWTVPGKFYHPMDTSMLRKTLVQNCAALTVLAREWVKDYDLETYGVVKTPPLRSLQKAVSWVNQYKSLTWSICWA